MKQTTLIIGILLLVLGLAVLGYEGYTTISTKQDSVVVAEGQSSAGSKTTLPLRPIAGGLSFVCGFILVLVSIKKSVIT